MMKVTQKQFNTLTNVRDRAVAANKAGEPVYVSESEFNLAKRTLAKLLASGAVIPDHAIATAKRLGLL